VKFTESLSLASGVRITWMLTVTVFFGIGFGIVWWPSTRTITTVKEQAKSLYDEANENESDVQHAAQLGAIAKRVADDVHQLSGQRSQSAVIEATLTLLSSESHAHAVDIRSIVPGPVASASPVPASASPAYGALVGTAIEIDVRGRFRNILAFISDLPRHNVLIEVSDISLVDGGDHSPKPTLGATIRATVFRYKGLTEGESQHVSRAL
jgi:Tfp pilus assembly protein PilO